MEQAFDGSCGCSSEEHLDAKLYALESAVDVATEDWESIALVLARFYDDTDSEDRPQVENYEVLAEGILTDLAQRIYLPASRPRATVKSKITETALVRFIALEEAVYDLLEAIGEAEIDNRPLQPFIQNLDNILSWIESDSA